MSDADVIIGLASVLVLGIGAQWAGRRTGIPSVLLLLPAGILAGDVLGLVEPQDLFGELLFPMVTLLVSLLLFQSGLQLRVNELPSNVRRTVALLVTVGLTITFGGAALVVFLVLDVSPEFAYLTGAILVVSGPTVVGPLLRAVRPKHPIGAVLNWESTALDPIGAALGVVVLNLVIATDRGSVNPVWQMLGRLGLGVGLGLLAAFAFVLVVSRFLVTDDMEAAVALLFAVAAFAGAEVLLSEAGLFATLTMGFVVANQRLIPTGRVAGFSETLEVVVIGTLFIVLGALVEIDDLVEHAAEIAIIVAALVLIVRPLTVAVCLVRGPFDASARVLVGAVAPRGVVAAATAAQFTGTVTAAGYEADFLLPVVFGVILGTGVVCGLLIPWFAKALGLVRPDPTRVALIGDDPWLMPLAQSLVAAGATVLVVSPDVDDAIPEDDPTARFGMETISLHDGAERIGEDLDRISLSSALVSGRPDAVVTLVVAQMIELLGRRSVVQVPDRRAPTIGDRWVLSPFGGGVTRQHVDEAIEAGGSVTLLSRPVDDDAIVLAAVKPNGAVDFVLHSPPGRADELIGIDAASRPVGARSEVQS